jgi:Baseplate J-like protein
VPDFPKAAELFRIARDEAVSRSERLTVNAVDRDGTDSNIMLYGAAVVGEEVIGQLAATEEGVWLASATGAKLDRWAFDRYSLTRKQASAAFVTVRFSTTVGAPSAFLIPSGTKLATSTGQEFITVVSVPYPLAGIGPVETLARSTLAGVDQNIGTGALNSITSSITNKPVDLVVTNVEAAAGGDNVEEDDDFKQRIARFFPSARRGTKSAIETGALEFPGVVRALAIEALQGTGYPTRALTLVISDRFTDALVRQGVSVPSYDTKSQAFAAQVFAALDEFRAFGMPVKVIVAQVRLVSVVLRLRFKASVTNPDAVALFARTLVVQLINGGTPGSTFDPAAAVTLLRSVSGLEVFGDEVASPVGPIVPTSPYQVLRSSLSIVTTDSQATLQSQATNV